MNAWKDNLKRERVKGGGEPPCPWCKIPRVRRSDYIRCCACGTNWLDGEDLNHDPRSQRQKAVQASIDSTSSTITRRKEDGHGR